MKSILVLINNCSNAQAINLSDASLDPPLVGNALVVLSIVAVMHLSRVMHY